MAKEEEVVLLIETMGYRERNCRGSNWYVLCGNEGFEIYPRMGGKMLEAEEVAKVRADQQAGGRFEQRGTFSEEWFCERVEQIKRIWQREKDQSCDVKEFLERFGLNYN